MRACVSGEGVRSEHWDTRAKTAGGSGGGGRDLYEAEVRVRLGEGSGAEAGGEGRFAAQVRVECGSLRLRRGGGI